MDPGSIRPTKNYRPAIAFLAHEERMRRFDGDCILDGRRTNVGVAP